MDTVGRAPQYEGATSEKSISDDNGADKGFDGRILWEIFDESHMPATKKIKPPDTAWKKHQKRYES